MTANKQGHGTAAMAEPLTDDQVDEMRKAWAHEPGDHVQYRTVPRLLATIARLQAERDHWKQAAHIICDNPEGYVAVVAERDRLRAEQEGD